MDQKNTDPRFNDMAPPYPGLQQPPQMMQTQPMMMQTQPMIITNQQVFVHSPLSHGPQKMVCPSCQATVTTKIIYQSNIKTHIVAGVLCFSLIWLCLCCVGLIPYCCQSIKTAEHYCPQCNHFFGSNDS